MKKKCYLLLAIPFLLTGCSSKASLEFVPYSFKEEDASMKEETKVEGKYHRNSTYSPIETEYSVKVNGTLGNTFQTLSDVVSSHDDKYVLSSTGDVHLLVVPVKFRGEANFKMEEKRINLQNAFFGDKSHNNYESVASYYNQSSYGQLRITGEVADWFECQFTVKEAELKTKTTGGRGETISRLIAAKALDDIKAKGKIDLSKYDLNNDGNIDAIYFVYDYPQDDGSSGTQNPLFWAYYDSAKHNFNSEGVAYNTTEPYLSSYSWSSINFMGENYLNSNIVEANTYIHETGHLLGLDDYYNTNPKPTSSSNISSSGVFQPTGFMDMMDYNIGDHNSFSKYLLNWTMPYVLDDECEITLHSFTKTGEFVLIPSPNWNGTPFDEYLLIEYYTPDMLNYAFTFPSYTYVDGYMNNKIFKYPTKHGLRVYHIDARLAYFKTTISKGENRLFDSPDLEEFMSSYGTKYVDFHNTNDTLGYVNNNSEVLIHLLEATGENSFGVGQGATNDTIFGRNASFGYDTFQNFEFNKVKSNSVLESFPYKFKVTALNSNEITVKFEKK